jgi:alkylhydroperoxidase family enzyme
MKPLYLRDIENNAHGSGGYADLIRNMRSAGAGLPGILHLFAFKPEATEHLERFSQAVMRGPSPLSAGFRELIAAFTSRLNNCQF